MFFFYFYLGALLIVFASGNNATSTSISSSSAISTGSISTSSSTTTLYPIPAICRNLNVMEPINIYMISGTWYEFARRGYGTYTQNLQCLQMEITYMNGTAIVNQTYADNMSNIHDQMSYEYVLQYNTTNISDYSILSTTYKNLPVPIFKILETDYVNYLIVCSYLPEWQQSAAAFAYFRDRSTADNDVFLIVREATKKYADFDGMNLVYQGEGCRSNSISLTLQTGNTIIALFIFIVLRLIQI